MIFKKEQLSIFNYYANVATFSQFKLDMLE